MSRHSVDPLVEIAARATAAELERTRALAHPTPLHAHCAALDPKTPVWKAQSYLLDLNRWIRDARPSSRGFWNGGPAAVPAALADPISGHPAFGHESDRNSIIAFVEVETDPARIQRVFDLWSAWDDHVQRWVREIRVDVALKPASHGQIVDSPPNDPTSNPRRSRIKADQIDQIDIDQLDQIDDPFDKSDWSLEDE